MGGIHLFVVQDCSNLNGDMMNEVTKKSTAFFLMLVVCGCNSGSQQTEFPKDVGIAAKDQTTTDIDSAVSLQDVTTNPNQDAAISPPKDSALPFKDTLSPPKDTAIPPKDTAITPPPPDAAIQPDTTPLYPLDLGVAPTNNKVAAIQYGSGQAALVSTSCVSNPTPDICAVKVLIAQARTSKASIIVVPEYALGQQYYEPIPTVGSNPGKSSTWPADAFIKIFSQEAFLRQIYLVIDLLTYAGTKPNYNYYNTQVAFGTDGSVVAVHHKFELFGSEANSLTPGNNVTVFSTPIGKMGLLICADIYGSSTLLNKLINTLQARVVALSSFWTVSGAVTWYSNFANNYNVYLIAANTTIKPGIGGGVYSPTGYALSEQISDVPNIVYATIPLP